MEYSTWTLLSFLAPEYQLSRRSFFSHPFCPLSHVPPVGERSDLADSPERWHWTGLYSTLFANLRKSSPKMARPSHGYPLSFQSISASDQHIRFSSNCPGNPNISLDV